MKTVNAKFCKKKSTEKYKNPTRLAIRMAAIKFLFFYSETFESYSFEQIIYSSQIKMTLKLGSRKTVTETNESEHGFVAFMSIPITFKYDKAYNTC